jgi:hypothetical protein
MTQDYREQGTGHDELDDRLATYAAARLSPSPEASLRMRRYVVARAADLAAIQAYEAERLAEAARQRRTPRGAFDWLHSSIARRGAAAFLAASIVFGASFGVLASPGGALYGTRLWLETAFLPAQPDARAEAHVDLLEQKVEDAEHAAGAADSQGVEAALTAYIAELRQAIADAQGDPARLAKLQQALTAHLLLLEQLQAAAPAEAQPAVHQAIADGRVASSEIDRGVKPAAPTVTPVPTIAPAQTSTPSGDGSGGDSQGGEGQGHQ